MDDDRDIAAGARPGLLQTPALRENSGQNPILRYIACFATVSAAARAAGISTEMLRQMRIKGFVSTRNRALRMAEACGGRLEPAELMALPAPARRRR
ncbi:hypothetical protein [Lysobacter silvisoli]|uniref:DNA-binding protein n=1 Tax=Lysobacter silvisoli TaxID=2293254 RepID=A0A371K471_9GAMM|nr:hypothetical protein [Lysobacter silvisoli]RDZ28662.1 hypothetical protein DX914_05920 [Lysobacter silvisoli]